MSTSALLPLRSVLGSRLIRSRRLTIHVHTFSADGWLFRRSSSQQAHMSSSKRGACCNCTTSTSIQFEEVLILDGYLSEIIR